MKVQQVLGPVFGGIAKSGAALCRAIGSVSAVETGVAGVAAAVFAARGFGQKEMQKADVKSLLTSTPVHFATQFGIVVCGMRAFNVVRANITQTYSSKTAATPEKASNATGAAPVKKPVEVVSRSWANIFTLGLLGSTSNVSESFDTTDRSLEQPKSRGALLFSRVTTPFAGSLNSATAQVAKYALIAGVLYHAEEATSLPVAALANRVVTWVALGSVVGAVADLVRMRQTAENPISIRNPIHFPSRKS